MDVNQGTTAADVASNGHLSAEAASPPAKKIIPTINVNAILFRAANEYIATEETRYYLQGVFVQPHPDKGVLLTSTDGHRMICVHDESGSIDHAAIIQVHSRAFAGIKEDKKKPDEAPRLTLDSDGHALVGTYRGIESAIIDGTYPDYARVLLPMVDALKKGVFAPASFNHEHLASFSKIAKLLGAVGRAIRVVTTSESDPALILFESTTQALGVLMPMRSSFQNGMPAFMRPILEPIAQKIEADRVAREKERAKAKAKKPKAKRAAKKKARAKKK